MNAKLLLRRVAAWALWHGGVTERLSRRSRDEGFILAYHRILPKKSSAVQWIQPGMYVAEETFEKQMGYLASNYRVISLNELKDTRDLDRICIITFDDGWADNFTHAYPVLKRYGLPATVFVTTGLIGTSQWHWPDRISYYVHRMSAGSLSGLLDLVRNTIGKSGAILSLCFDDRQDLAGKLIAFLKGVDHEKRYLVMDALDRAMEQLKVELQEQRPWLTWEEVRKMSDCVSYGSHTHNHEILTSIPLENVRHELETSRKVLSEQIGTPVDFFCYPNGNYNDAIMNELKIAGYKLAVTTWPGTIGSSKSPLELNRLMVHEDRSSTIPLFACKMTTGMPFFS